MSKILDELIAKGVSGETILAIQALIEDAGKWRSHCEHAKHRMRLVRERSRTLSNTLKAADNSVRERSRTPSHTLPLSLTEATSVASVRDRNCKSPRTSIPDPWPWPIEMALRDEFERFKADALTHDRRYVRWDWAWKKWELNQPKYANGGHNGRGRKHLSEVAAELAEECAQREREIAAGGLFGPTEHERSRRSG